MGTLVMSRKERTRLEILSRVRDGQITVMKAAELLSLGERQARRVWSRYQSLGDAGLVHGLRGRGSNHAADPKRKESALRLYRRKYSDFGPTLAAEHMGSSEGVSVGRQTLWRWLVAEGLWTRRRRRKKHRSRRERKEHLGEMAQMDGSHHDWFEGRRGWCVLMVMIDDATGRTFARFFEGETTSACFEVFGRYARKHGLPRALYVDRDSIYRSDRQATVEEELRAESPLTQFGRAMKELEVELILANSPQAKGRVERMNGTLQDRLVKEMRLAKISDIAAANAFLAKTFLPKLNRKFTVSPRGEADLHRRVPRGVWLDEVLCFEERRVVSSDWCVCWRNRVLQLDQRHESLGLVRRSVTVREKLNGTIQVVYRERKLKFKELAARPARRIPHREPVRNNKRWLPGANHPWQRPAVAGVVPRVSLAPAAPTRDLHAERRSRTGVTVLLQQKG